MAGWTLKDAGGLREGLTIYQLQELVRSGRVGADAEVSDGGPFRPVRDVPRLAGLLGDAAPEPSGRRTVRVGALELEVGPDGRPLPPPPEVVAQLLATTSDAEQGRERARRMRRAVVVAAAVLIAGALVFVGTVLVRGW